MERVAAAGEGLECGELRGARAEPYGPHREERDADDQGREVVDVQGDGGGDCRR